MERKQLIQFIEKDNGSIKLKNKIGEIVILSDDEIEEGDNVFDLHRKIILGCPDKENASFYKLSKHRYKKIIASTDKSLKEYHIQVEERFQQSLPQPSKEWIEYFVSEYNKGNIMDEVMVEYEDYALNVITDEELYRPKVNPDNTINIKPVEETWDDILSKFELDVGFEEGVYVISDFKNWLKENYYQVPKQLKK